MADETNPFFEGLQRIARVPINAAKLPFQVLGEVLNTPMARAERQVGEERARLARDVTGQESAFSPTRNTLSKLSLGLYQPKTDQVDPNALSPEQRQRFDQLTPLQQRLLQAKRSGDWASVVLDGSLFEEPAPPTPQTDLGKYAADAEAGFIDPRVAAAKQSQAFDEALQGPAPQTELGKIRADQAAGLISPEEADRRVSQLLTDVRKRNTKVVKGALIDVDTEEVIYQAQEDQPGLDPEDRAKLASKVFNDEQALRTGARQDLKLDKERGDAFRSATSIFRLEDPSRVSPDTIAEIEKSVPGINLKTRSSNAIRDIALMFSFMRTLEPGGIFREGEQAMVKRARELGLPDELVKNVFQGEGMTDEQRAQMFEVMSDVFRSQFIGYENSILDYRKIALRNRVEGGGMNPANVLDPLRDIRASLEQGSNRDLPDEMAGLPETDTEALEMLLELYEKEQGAADPDPGDEKFTKFAARLGFRVPQ